MAKKIIQEGAEIIITGRNEQRLVEATKQLGPNAKYEIFDVQDVEKIEDFMSNIYSKYGMIDCLINNAGISLHEGEIKNVTIEGFEKQINTNLRGSYFLAQAYINKIRENRQKNGNIIFISSERGSQCDDIPYGLTKVAINSLTEGLSRRVYKQGIRVNAVAPGITASDMTNIDASKNMYCNYNSSNRYFMPEEVAEVVCFLISDVSKCISGEVINCDAGDHLNPRFKK